MVSVPRAGRQWSGPSGARAAVLPVVGTVALLCWPVLTRTSAAGMHPHGYCYLWDPTLVTVHVGADALIGLSYVTISLTLAYLVYRGREHIPFSWMFLAFGTFIIACGATHFMEIWTLWFPAFWFSADVKIVTAVASLTTAVALPPLVPRVLGMVEAAQLSERRRADLDSAQREIAALAALRESEEERARLLVRERDARSQAEAANRMKDEFLANVSHELRTPLNAILGWARLLRSGTLDADQVPKAVETIERNAVIQVQMIEDLLDVSRIITGQLRLDIRPTDLTTVIDAAVDAIQPAATARQIRLTRALGQVPAPVSVDPDRLQQVVWNLLSNAVKFTPNSGCVHLVLRQTGSQIEIEVSDTGVGLAPDLLPRVFERFTQGRGTRRHHGLGLGLSIVRHLTELHGGTVSVSSPGPGRGATFTVSLLLVAMARERSRTGPPGSAEAVHLPDDALRGVRLLIVDDDADARDLLAAVVHQYGAVTITAEGPGAARARLAEQRVDVVISDIEMPHEDGHAFVRALRADEQAQGRPRTPTVAVTAYARVQDRLEAFAAGFDMYVTKPIEPAELIAVVLALLRRTTP